MFVPLFQTLCSAGFYRFRPCRWLSAGPPPFLLSLIRFLDHRLPLCFFSLTQWPLCLAWTAIPLWSLDRWLFDGGCTLVDRSSPRFLTDDDRPWTVCVSSEILVFDVTSFVLIFRGFIERLGLFLDAVYCWPENGVLDATTGVRLLERRRMWLDGGQLEKWLTVGRNLMIRLKVNSVVQSSHQRVLRTNWNVKRPPAISNIYREYKYDMFEKMLTVSFMKSLRTRIVKKQDGYVVIKHYMKKAC